MWTKISSRTSGGLSIDKWQFVGYCGQVEFILVSMCVRVLYSPEVVWRCCASCSCWVWWRSLRPERGLATAVQPRTVTLSRDNGKLSSTTWATLPNWRRTSARFCSLSTLRLLVTQRRSVACVTKNVGCFQRRLFVRLGVFVNTIPSERVNIGWWNLG